MSKYRYSKVSGDASIREYISLEEDIDGEYTIVSKLNTPLHKIAIVEQEGNLLVYSGGYVMFSTTDDEDRYSEAMVHIAMAAAAKRKRVLIIGGGGGITTREALRYSDVRKITTLDLDEVIMKIGKKLEPVVAFNKGSLNHDKVKTVNEDGRKFLEETDKKWDVIILDLPEPSRKSVEVSRLYSVEFYSLLKERLNPGGAISIACSNGDSTPQYLWSIYATLRDAGFHVLPYYYLEEDDADDWLYCLATTSEVNPNDLSMVVSTKNLTTERLRQMFDLPYYLNIAKNTGKIQTDDNTVLVDIIDKAYYNFE
ncbi:spermidine synthase [Bacillus sp. V5-8f]|uniref:spermidine synthase n=1 Tax=Bacillus sp. V5-8f TaxID=2053044 RepID=UPI0015E135C8|nr:spermidine synthase [Bacillus sp. V5-8f]